MAVLGRERTGSFRMRGWELRFTLISMENTSGVDDDRLAGHGLGAAHGDHHVGAIALVGCALQQRARSSICSARRLDVARVPSSSPGATQFTRVSGAIATAMQRVR